MKLTHQPIILTTLSMGLLSGCFGDLDDIKQHMASVAAATPAVIEPIRNVKEFAHVKYISADKRSPFLEPKPEAIAEKLGQLQDCLHPDRARQKEPLELYSLTNLRMKGTLGYAGDQWALVESTTDGSVYRVSKGNYLGLFHGKITAVLDNQLRFTEMVPDGTGCWKERATVIDMSEAGESNASK